MTSRARTALGALALAASILTGGTPAAAQSPFASPFAPASGARPDYVPGELLVGYRAATTRADRSATRRAGGVKFKERLLVRDVEVVKVEGGQTVRGAVAALERRADVDFAEPHSYARLETTTPNDPVFSKLWGLHNIGQKVDGVPSATTDADIDAPEAWDIQRGQSALVKVAVVDSGVNAAHGDLANNVVAGWDFVDNDATTQDLNGHGTHVAGTIAAEGNNANATTGVAWDAEIMPLRVFGVDGYTPSGSAVNAFAWAAQNGAKVVNGSLSSVGQAAAYQRVVSENPNTLFVVAASNGGPDGIGDNNDAANQARYPCNVTAANLICVAASDQNDGRASFSNFGTTSVDIAAPGTEIHSAKASIKDVWYDNFEFSPSPYDSSGGWGYQNHSLDGDWTPDERDGNKGDGGWSWSEGSGTYPPNANRITQRNPAAGLAGYTNCGMSFQGAVEAEDNFDFLRVEISNGGGTWTQVGAYSSTDEGTWRDLFENINLTPYSNRPEFWLRFRFTSDGDNSSIDGNPALEGAYVDEIVINCQDGPSWATQTMQGTSMATPHVAGAAALLYAQAPGSTPTGVKSLLLDNGDPSPIPTVSGRRLNIYKSLLAQTGLKPDTTVVAGPPEATTSSTATFFFSSTHNESTYECSTDGGVTFSPCYSGQTFGGYTTHGEKTFRVRAVNPVGARDPAPAEYKWVVDLERPDTYFISKPPALTKEGYAKFVYSSHESGVTFECARDFESYAVCPADGKEYFNLSHGRHTFRVKAKDKAGQYDLSEETFEWDVDRDVPETSITSGPEHNSFTTATSASFGFSSDETGAKFECSLDGAAFTACTHPTTYTGLSARKHTFRVQARDLAGNVDDASPAAREWTVVPPPPPARPDHPGGVSAATTVRADFDGDGKTDVAVGAPGEDIGTTADAGLVHVLYGGTGALGATGSQYFHQNTTGIADLVEAGDAFGGSLAAGDFNGDGHSDLAIAAPGEDAGTADGAGAVHVLMGSASGLSATGSQLHVDPRGTPAAGDGFGSTLVAADTTGDGRSELVVGAPGEDWTPPGGGVTVADAGVVYALLGTASGTTGPGSGYGYWHQESPGIYDTAETGDRFGSALAAGDVGGDGRADVAVGVPGEDVGTVQDAGLVHLLNGESAGALTYRGSQLWTQNTTGVPDTAETGDRFGAALSIGNYGEGTAGDLAVGVPDENLATVADAGAVAVLYSTGTALTGTGSEQWTQASSNVPDVTEAGDGFGSALAAVKLGTGAEHDLAVGVPREDVRGAVDAGAVQVLEGGPSGIAAGGGGLLAQTSMAANLPDLSDTAEHHDHFGAALTGGDVGGTSAGDLVVGVPEEGIFSTAYAGAVQVVYGEVGGLTTTGNHLLSQYTTGIFDTVESGDGFGASLGR